MLNVRRVLRYKKKQQGAGEVNTSRLFSRFLAKFGDYVLRFHFDQFLSQLSIFQLTKASEMVKYMMLKKYRD